MKQKHILTRYGVVAIAVEADVYISLATTALRLPSPISLKSLRFRGYTIFSKCPKIIL